MGVGRFICVALPLIITGVSIVALLAAGLSGVVHSNNLYLARVDLSKFSARPVDLQKVVENFLDNDGIKINTDAIKSKIDDVTDNVNDQIDNVTDKANDKINDATDQANSKINDATNDINDKLNDDSNNNKKRVDTSTLSGSNITAKELGLSEHYDFYLWGYCYSNETSGKDRKCTKSKFNWVNASINETFIKNFGKSAGIQVDISDEITTAMKFFAKLVQIAELLAVFAIVVLAMEFIIGFFANFSRAVSCLTWLIAGLAAVLTGAFAGVATATAVVLVGATEAATSHYGGKATFGKGFLGAAWIACAAAVASGLFWLFTICCCKPEHRQGRSKRHHGSDTEKLLPTGGNNVYVSLGGGGAGDGDYNNHNRGSYAPSFKSNNNNNRRSDLAYEPYSNVGSGGHETGHTRQSVDVAYEPYSSHA